MKTRLASGVLLFAVFLLMAVPGSAQQTLNIGVNVTLSEVPLYLAVERGWLKEAGIVANIQPFKASGDMLAPTATGQLQMFSSGVGVGLFNAIARGLPLVLVAGSARNVPGHDTQLLMLRTDLKEKIATPADLKGKKFATNAVSSVFNYAMGKTLESAGLTLKDVDMVVMPVPDMVVAFKTKAIDMAYIFEPVATLAEAQGVAIKWKKLSEVAKPNVQTAGLFFNRDWAKKDSDLAVTFLTVWLRGARAFYEAYKYRTDRKEMVEIAIKYTTVKQPDLYDKMEWPFANPNGYLDLESIQDQSNWYYAQGLSTHKLKADQVVDHTYVEKALKKLGEYKPRG